jgi:hypothetical protein
MFFVVYTVIYTFVVFCCLMRCRSEHEYECDYIIAFRNVVAPRTPFHYSLLFSVDLQHFVRLVTSPFDFLELTTTREKSLGLASTFLDKSITYVFSYISTFSQAVIIASLCLS